VSPVVRVVNHVAAELKASPKLQGEAVRAADVWSRLPSVVQRLADSATSNVAGAVEGTLRGVNGGVTRRLILGAPHMALQASR
jgi:hypothetical protein